VPFDWTEHRVVVAQREPSVEPVEVDFRQPEEAIASQDLDVAHRAPLSMVAKPHVAPGPTEKFENGGARVGDHVVVRYSDTNKVRRVLLSSTENRPDDGVLHISQPLGRAVVGANVDDE